MGVAIAPSDLQSNAGDGSRSSDSVNDEQQGGSQAGGSQDQQGAVQQPQPQQQAGDPPVGAGIWIGGGPPQGFCFWIAFDEISCPCTRCNFLFGTDMTRREKLWSKCKRGCGSCPFHLDMSLRSRPDQPTFTPCKNVASIVKPEQQALDYKRCRREDPCTCVFCFTQPWECECEKCEREHWGKRKNGGGKFKCRCAMCRKQPGHVPTEIYSLFRNGWELTARRQKLTQLDAFVYGSRAVATHFVQNELEECARESNELQKRDMRNRRYGIPPPLLFQGFGFSGNEMTRPVTKAATIVDDVTEAIDGFREENGRLPPCFRERMFMHNR